LPRFDAAQEVAGLMVSSHPSSHPPSPELIRLVRNALTHLYDSAYLENHPLAALLDRGGNLDHVTRAQRLRRTLLDCIDNLRPPSAEGAGVEASRAHAILTYRYVDGMAMEDIAARRALSERQTYRELERGLEAVAALLRDRLGEPSPPAEPPLLSDDRPLAEQVQVAQAEVARLRQTVAAESLAPDEIFQGVLTMLALVLQQLAVRVDVASGAPWPRVIADRVMFRQALLSLLTYAGHAVAPGDLTVTTDAEGERMLRVSLTGKATVAEDGDGGRKSAGGDPVRLGVARSLVEAQGGRLATQVAGGRWRADVWFPTATRRTILVVDDNQALIALFQRYVAGHEITIIGAHDGEQARRLAAELRPELITLDVMMPSLDGWDVLQQLKATPETADIPVVICSVLHEPELARGMGASDYLVKPVQPDDLLAVLRRHLGRPTPAR
jgi:CheY-like chemotaxis protein